MSAKAPLPTGCEYFTCYSGVLNILEEVFNVAIVLSIAISGYTTEGHVLNFTALLALLTTAIFMALHAKDVIRTSRKRWTLIEVIAVLIVAVLLAIAATFALSVYTRGYIITAIIGYLSSAIYFVDTFDKYQIATMPVARYAWTMPNMPDLS